MAASLETGVLYCDDNLARLARMPSESVDLVYLDPPFFSSRNYEVIWGDEAEVRSFEDRWEGGIQHYVGWMRDRARELHRVLKPNGSLYLHCDPHASHYLKVMLDEIFSPGQFRSEIIWKRSGAHNAARRWGPIHDVILYYSKTNARTWNPVYANYNPTYVESKFKNVDEAGRRFQPITLTPSGVRNGETGKPWRGIDPTAHGYHWKYPPTKLDELDAAGLIYWPKKRGGLPRLKQFLDEAKGLPVQDVWTDIDPINARARERLGYPTQKPETLLERIIAASSNPGEVVLDPFCGCGTTVAVAERLGRKWVGIDISPTAMEIMRRRLMKLTHGRVRLRIEGLPDTAEKLKGLKPFEFQNWVIAQINGTHAPRKSGDMGIDGYAFMTGDPVQVKQSEKVGRNVVDNFETALRRAGRDTGYIIAFSFTRNAREEVARARWEDGLHIRLIKVSDLFRAPDRSPIHELIGERELLELPLPTLRKRQDLPTAEELIASDKAHVSAG